MSLAPGTRLGPYEVTAKLGEGGMGEVWRAKDSQLGREVALKVLPEGFTADPERTARFEREAKILASLNHPNIAQIYGLETSGETRALVMELVEGPTLAERLESGCLPLDESLSIARQVAEALEEAHAKGVIHRDLKPQNIKSTPSGKVKVLDFGLAKQSGVDSHSETALEVETQAGALLGTVPYMSPEQVEGRWLDARSDLFSLGVVLHQMLAGQHPFRGESVAGWITSILRDDPPEVSSLDARLPNALSQLVLACLSKDPASRPASAREVRERLAALARPAAAGAAATAERIKVVVVLPFANRSGDPDNEYFSDGLTEEVIADLSHLSGLRTISRNSAMQLKGSDKGTAAIARELGVTHLVTGSVRRAGNALRVTAELVEARTDASIWSDKYSGTVEDVFGIQEEIARKIVAALEVELTSAERQRAAEQTRAPDRPIDDPVAWDCYLRARQEMYVWTSESLARAHRLVDDALAIVGDAPLLFATKGQLHWNEVNANLSPADEGLAQASRCVERALALDAEFPLAFYVRGLVAGMRGDVESALRDLYLALESLPGDANVITEVCRYSNVSGLRGHFDLVERALQIDPLTPVTQLVLSSYRWINGPLDEAVAPARRAIELAPAVGSLLQVIAAWQIADGGETEEAAEVLRAIGERSPGTPTAAWAHFLERTIAGDEEGALSVMTPELEAGLRNEFSARMMAQGHARLGRRDDALRWARTAIGYGFVNHPSWTEVDRSFAPLRDDPEFRKLMDGIRPRWQALVEWEQSIGRGSA